MKKTIFILLIMFMFVGIAKAEIQAVPNNDVTITFTMSDTQATHITDEWSDICWFQSIDGACSRKTATQMTITIQNDMDEPLETYKIFIPGTNGLIPEYPGSFNFFWHKIKYDDSLGQYYVDEEYTDDHASLHHVYTTTETIPAHSTVTIGGYFWYFTDDENLTTITQKYYTYQDVDPNQQNTNNNNNQTGDNNIENPPADNNDLDGTHEVSDSETGTVKYVIKFEGGKDVKEGSMEDTPVYEGQKVKLPKNKFKNDKYIFAGWKVYLEDAEGKRTEVKVNGKALLLKDCDELPEIDVPRGSTLVLAAQWTTNPKTGYLVPIAIVVLAIIIGLVYFIKRKSYNKIANI